MGKKNKVKVKYWFEGGRVYVENDQLPGVTFRGRFLDQALSRMTAFLSLDVMGEYKKRQEPRNEEEQVQIQAGEDGGPDF